MSNKDYSDYALKSYDKDVIVEEVLDKLKEQGCFDAKRKQFLSEITNKSTYQNLHTKVENLATKFLETVRWPPSVQKHQLREQLRLHIQSTDQFNNCVSRLIEQEVNCKIQGELKPMIESKACEYLEVNYEKWKQNILNQIYERFKVESPIETIEHKSDIKKEPLQIDSHAYVEINDSEVTQSHDEMDNLKIIKSEINLNQSNVVNSSSFSSNVQTAPKYCITTPPIKSPQTLHSNFFSATPPTMPPPIGFLPHPQRILPNSLPPNLPPPPPPIYPPIESVPPPPPPEEKSLPPPPPPENGPNTPTDEYIPKFHDLLEDVVEKVKTGLLKTPEKPIDKTTEVKAFSPKKMIWGNIVLPVQDISDDSASDSERNEHERRRYSRKSPPKPKHSSTIREIPVKNYDEPRHKETWRNVERSSNRQHAPPHRRMARRNDHCRPKSNEYTDVSSESFTEMEFKDVQMSSSQNNANKQRASSSSDDSRSSSSNDHTLDLIRKINKKKTKLRKRQKTPTVQSSSSYSSSESSSRSSSSENSRIHESSNNCNDERREYRVFGRSQSKEKDMDISVGTQSPSIDPKWTSPRPEINLDSVESVQLRKDQIKARLEEIDAKRSMLQKQQLLTANEPSSTHNTTSSSSSDSSSDNNSSSLSSDALKVRDKDSKKLPDLATGSITSPRINQNFENEPNLKNEPDLSNTMETEHDLDSEPEEGELSSESRSGSLKRENNTISDETQVLISDETSPDVKETIKMEIAESVVDPKLTNVSDNCDG